ncbi:alpha/beta hydrolase [Nocardioides sp.]|uniref:alpha/beta hydrolase n=1 Tax=Nocardioides sp. TaxID=35761 RepID=UPI002B268C93|nr:alpha/beta hydrolase [Nocardioides sp.]
MRDRQTPDILGEPWESETISLPPDGEGPVTATLVRRRAERSNGRAVLHVHGFADYFFHTEYAEWWLERGYDFYAVDLRKYGRSMLPHQTPTYVADLSEYFADLDACWWRVAERDEHDHVVLSAHSTGGLTAALWSDARQPAELAGVVLNSPWFDLQGPAWMRTPVADAVLERLGRLRPMHALGRDVTGVYGRSLHVDFGGEWDYDLGWKPIESYPIRLGWLRAIRRGHAALHAGLSVLAPVLVLSSASTRHTVELDDIAHNHDIVLDVPQIRRWSTSVGPHISYVAIDGARHDVVLSRPEARALVYDQLERWRRAHLD